MGQLKNFEKASQKLLNKYKIPGSMVALAAKGEILYRKSFGYRNVQQAKPVTDQTVFGLASITKVFTCIAIMQLQEKGQLNVNDPIVNYLPEFRIGTNQDFKRITIHHSMTHSSGISPLPSLDHAMQKKKNTYYVETNHIPMNTFKELMEFIANSGVELFSAPGTQFSYSNDAYALLGAIIERVSDMPYEEYIQNNIIKPAGMKHSHFTIEAYRGYDNISICYEEEDKETEQVYATQEWWDAPSMRATGFLKSTAKDIMRFSEIFINGGLVNGKRILTEESITQMTTPHIRIHQGKFYGYGLAINPDYFGKSLLEHGGSLPSVSAKFCVIPEDGVATIILSNLMGFPTSRMMDYLINDYFERDIYTDYFNYDEYEIDTERLNVYTGRYQSDEGMDLVLEIKNKQLVLCYKGKEYSTTFISRNTFLVYMDDVREIVEVLFDNNGYPEAVSIFSRVVPMVEK